MKRLLAGIVAALAAAACVAPTETTNRSAESANRSAETKPATISNEEVMAKEKQAWEAVKTKDAEGFRNVMANDGIYVSHHGILDPAGTINETKELELTDLSFSDWKVLPVDKDSVLVTYTAHINGRIKGMPLVSSQVRSSTAWVRREGKWLAIYHQDSEAKPASAPKNKPAKSTATPATTTAPATTGSDPIANEKIIWDTLKSKNYGTFADLLAPDALEVEPEGVFDKAGTVKSVSEVDLSQVALSDWKSLKIDDDTTLVTYMVKGGSIDPSGEHHTTIWARRDGKWLALFHQGTPVLKELHPVSEKPSSPAAKAKPKASTKY